MPRTSPSRRVAKAVTSFAEITDPLARLDAIRVAREALERLEAQTVSQARAAGATWGQVGSLYGVSKQAAQQRFRASKGKG